MWNSCACSRMRRPLAGSASVRKYADVRDALFLVDDQVVDDVEILGLLLREQASPACCGSGRRSSCARAGRRRGSRPNSAGRSLIRERDRDSGGFRGRELARAHGVRSPESALRLDRRRARRQFDACRATGSGSNAARSGELRAVVSLVAMHPGVVRRMPAPVARRARRRARRSGVRAVAHRDRHGRARAPRRAGSAPRPRCAHRRTPAARRARCCRSRC